MKKILITSTDLMMLQFLVPHVFYLKECGYEIEVACSNVGGRIQEVSDILDKCVKVYKIDLKRNPFRLKNYRGIGELKQICDGGKYDLIWTNEPVMSVATRIAAIDARKKETKVLYMVHGFHFFKGAAKRNWVFYYPIERIMAHFSDALVTINKEDYERGKTFAFKKVFYIHGIGVDTLKFKNTVINRDEKRRVLGIPVDAVIVLSVGELENRKNHETVIRAIGRLKNKNIHYVICGKGSLEEKLKSLCKELDIIGKVHFLGYRMDIAEICKMSDIYAFPSIREGLGIAAIEGMAAGLPLVASSINGIKDYAENKKTGYTYSPYDDLGFAQGIDTLAEHKELRKRFGEYNSEKIEKFDILNTKKEVRKIIDSLLGDREKEL